jgi:hypothetical protein
MAETTLYHIVYVSSASHLFSKQELLDLLEKAREKNHQLGVTGLLLYKEGDFIQLIEGDKEAVKSLFTTISADPRHNQTFVLLEEETDRRLFNDWSMGFRDLSDPEVQSTPGFSQYMNTPLVAESFVDDPSGCLGLMEVFKPVF